MATPESCSKLAKEIYELETANKLKTVKCTGTMMHVWDQKKWVDVPSGFSVSGDYLIANQEDAKKFEEEAGKKIAALGIEPDCSIEPCFVGLKFSPITGATPVMAEGATPVEVAVKPGEVTLFDFWATWCPPCQGPMGHNQEMLEHHPEWAGKARIVGLSIDKDISAPRERVKDKKWEKVEHYWLPNAWQSDACKRFSINGIPFCVLVDKKGEVVKTGHPMSMQLDKNIPRLIAGEALLSDGEEGGVVKDPSYDFKTFKEDLVAMMGKVAADTEKLARFTIIGKFQNLYDKAGSGKVSSTGLELRLAYFDTLTDVAEHIKSEFKAKFESRIEVRFREHVTKLRKLAFGSKCSKCSKSIVGENQYLCVQCKPEVYFCENCYNTGTKAEPKGLADLAHPHGMYFMPKGAGKKLDEIVLEELKTSELKEWNRAHRNPSCDSCGENPIMGIRWKCANCETVDICNQCFLAGRDKSNAKYAEVTEKCAGVKHDMENHVYVRQEFEGFVRLQY